MERGRLPRLSVALSSVVNSSRHDMARLPRYALPGQPQHVIQRGNNRLPVFVDRADYGRFRHDLVAACARYGCAVHAYVLMTNHFHLLLTAPGRGALAKAMQSLGARYVAYFNRRHRRTGTLWEGRFPVSYTHLTLPTSDLV